MKPHKIITTPIIAIAFIVAIIVTLAIHALFRASGLSFIPPDCVNAMFGTGEPDRYMPGIEDLE